MGEQLWLVSSRVALPAVEVINISVSSLSSCLLTEAIHKWEGCPMCVGRELFSSFCCQSWTPTPHSQTQLVFTSSSASTLQSMFCTQIHVHKLCMVMVSKYFCCQKWAFVEEKVWRTIRNCDCTLRQQWADLKNIKCCKWRDGRLRGWLINHYIID